MRFNLLDRISSATADLSKSERKVATAVLSRPQLVLNENISDLAKRSKVSEPTVFRFCRRFGANGFPDFKLALSSCVSKETGDKIPDEIKDNDSVQVVVSKLFGNVISGIKGLERSLNYAVLERSADVICSCRRLVMLAEGYGAFAAEAFNSSLQLNGINSVLVKDPAFMAQIASGFSEEDLVLAFSRADSDSSVIAAARLAFEKGSSIIGICPQDSALQKYCSLCLNWIVVSESSDLAKEVNNSLMITMISRALNFCILRNQRKLSKENRRVPPLAQSAQENVVQTGFGQSQDFYRGNAQPQLSSAADQSYPYQGPATQGQNFRSLDGSQVNNRYNQQANSSDSVRTTSKTESESDSTVHTYFNFDRFRQY